MKPPLPVTIVLPILNCGDKLGAHLDQLAEVLSNVQAVVVVDSHSEDGSLDLAKEKISHPRVEFLTVPRGLYAAWNAGISTARTPYVSISTIGDGISLVGIQHLVEVAEAFSADVVISPPRCVGSGGVKAESRRFPIHQLLDVGGIVAPVLLPPWLAYTLATGFSIESLLGSSAGNIYRSSLLQACPFPTEFGKAGDTAWFRRVVLESRVVITPQVVANFLLDQDHGVKAQGDVSDLLEKLNAVSNLALDKWQPSNSEDVVPLRILNQWRTLAGISPEQTLDAVRHLEGIAATNEQQLAYIKDLEAEISKMREVMQMLDTTCAARERQIEQLAAVSGWGLIRSGILKCFGKR